MPCDSLLNAHSHDMSELDGARDNPFFWVLICVCLLITVWNFTVYALYKYYENKVVYIKAKDPFNLIMILLAGAFMSWGKFVYSMPLFSVEGKVGGAVGCLVFGYIFQHLFGSTLLFYSLVHRLIKYGSVYQVFEKCMCIKRGDEENQQKWTTSKYIEMFKKHFKIIIGVSVTIILIPMIIFIASVHSAKAIHVNESTGYCNTSDDWKFVFVIINLFYFLLLGFLACLIPRYIKDDFLNEGSALAHSIIMTLAIFLFETWLSYRNAFDVVPWVGISILLIFLIPTFIIARIFWYPIYQAVKGNEDYLCQYIENSDKKTTTGSYYVLLVSQPDINDTLLVTFLSYCLKNETEIIHYITQMNAEHSVRVGTLVSFTFAVLKFRNDMIKEKFGRKPGLILNSLYYNDYNNIMESFFYKGTMENSTIIYPPSSKISETIPLDLTEFNKISNQTSFNLGSNVFDNVLKTVLLHLYNAYFKSFSETDEFYNVRPDELSNKKTSIAYQQLVGTSEEEKEEKQPKIPLKSLTSFFKIEDD